MRAVRALHLALPEPIRRPRPARWVVTEHAEMVFAPRTTPPADARVLERARRLGAWTLDGARGRTEVLEGTGGQTARLVTLEGAQPFRLPPSALLTPAQDVIAGYAARGATVPEMARSTGRTKETIKSHLRAIYDRLEIGSRVELAQIL